jgi:signal transduction histidine kinase
MNRLSEYDTVVLSLPDDNASTRASDLPCTVVALYGSRVALQPIGGRPHWLPARIEHVLLSFEHRRALIGLKGVVRHDRATGRIEFTVEDGVQVERRRSTRVRLSLSVVLQRADASEPCQGTTVNLSADGLLAAATLDVSLGERILVTLQPPEPHGAIRIAARVVRQEAGRIAVEFLADAAHEVRTRIAELVVAAQEALLRSPRGPSTG